MPEEDMEMEAALGGDEEESKKKGGLPLKMIIIIVGGVLILGAGGFFGWKYFMAGPDEAAKKPAAEQAKGKAEGEAAKEGQPEKPGTVITLEPFIVNLADPTGKRYLKLSLAVDAKDEKIKADVEARMPQIRDSILLLLTSKSFADISTVAGKIRLRNEVLKIFNRILGSVGAVHAIYFTEFVIQ